jgi:hypothetical protein
MIQAGRQSSTQARPQQTIKPWFFLGTACEPRWPVVANGLRTDCNGDKPREVAQTPRRAPPRHAVVWRAKYVRVCTCMIGSVVDAGRSTGGLWLRPCGTGERQVNDLVRLAGVHHSGLWARLSATGALLVERPRIHLNRQSSQAPIHLHARRILAGRLCRRSGGRPSFRGLVVGWERHDASRCLSVQQTVRLARRQIWRVLATATLPLASGLRLAGRRSSAAPMTSGGPVWTYWNATSVKLLSFRECRRSRSCALKSRSALNPISRCCLTRWR